MKFKDLTGQRFGKLIVIKRVESKVDKSGKKRTMWCCLCDCGNEVVVSSDYLHRSKCPSCGCEATKNRIEYNRIDNVGEKYGRLTIVDIIWEAERAKAVCKCDCGNDYIGIKSDIVGGHTKSCGCLHSEVTSIVNTKDWTGYVAESGVKFVKQHHMNNKGQWVWECECPFCGNPFYELPAKVNNGHTTSCGCRVQSFGESFIKAILEEIGTEFIPQYSFPDCKHINVLHFDFAIIKNNYVLGLIEYDGRQHFEPVDFFGRQEGFERTQKRDQIKNQYCKLNNIPLLRFKYTLSLSEIREELYKYYLSLTTAVVPMAT
jgi:hypothetical protein